jgi:hypothetical protein
LTKARRIQAGALVFFTVIKLSLLLVGFIKIETMNVSEVNILESLLPLIIFIFVGEFI